MAGGADSAKGAPVGYNGWDRELHHSPANSRVVLIYPLEASSGLATSVLVRQKVEDGGKNGGENLFIAIEIYTLLLCAIENYSFSSLPLVYNFVLLCAIAVTCILLSCTRR